MRAFELLRESDYPDEVRSFIEDILIDAKAHGRESIPTDDFVLQLNNRGLSIDGEALVNALNGNPLVQDASADMVTLHVPDGFGNERDENTVDQNRDAVERLAQKAAKRDIG